MSGRREKRSGVKRRKTNRYRISREVKWEKRKRYLTLWGYVVGFLLAVFLLSSVFVLGYRYLITTPYLRVSRIEIHGCKWLQPAKVKEIARVREGQNLLALNLKKIRKRIERNPWVEAVTLNRVIPDTLFIDVKEREPMAFVQLDGLYLFDHTGRLIIHVKDPERFCERHYLIITGLDKKQVLKAGKIPPEVSNCIRQFISMGENNSGWFDLKEVSEARWDKLSGLTIRFDNGLIVALGKGSFSLKFSMLRKVFNEIYRRSIDGEIREIDLRCSPRVYISGRFTHHLISG